MKYNKIIFLLIISLFSLNCFSVDLEKILEKEEIKIEYDKDKISNQDFSKIINETENIIYNVFGRDSNNIINQIQSIKLSKGVRYYNKEKIFLKLKNENIKNDFLSIVIKKIENNFKIIYLENSTNYPDITLKMIENGIMEKAADYYLEKLIEKKDIKNFVFEKRTKIVENYRFIFRKKINGFYSKYSKAKIFLKENGFFTRFDNLISSKYFPAIINYTFDKAKEIAVKKYYEIRKNKIASYRKRGHEIPSDSTNEVEVRPLEYIDVNKKYVGIYEHLLGKMLLDEVVNKKRPIYMRPNYNFVFEEEELPKSGILPKIEMPSDQNYESIFYYDESKSRFLDEERLIYPILLVSDDRENFINGYYRDFLVIIYIDAETGEMVGGR